MYMAVLGKGRINLAALCAQRESEAKRSEAIDMSAELNAAGLYRLPSSVCCTNLWHQSHKEAMMHSIIFPQPFSLALLTASA